MKSITKYIANDGTEFADPSKCAEHEILCDKIAEVMAPLGTVPEAVKDGHGWLQHDLDVVMKAKQGILDLCKPRFAASWPQFNEPAEKIHPLSIIGRILNDNNGPLDTAWNRFCRIDEQGREHQQTYFAYTAGPEAAHICVEDRRAKHLAN